MTTNENVSSFRPERTFSQNTCIILGVLFTLLGAAHYLRFAFLGMDLIPEHELGSVYLVSAILCFAAGMFKNINVSYFFSICFGLAYLIVGFVGYVFWYPNISQIESMGQNPFIMSRFVAHNLNFSSSYHLLHLFIGVTCVLGTILFDHTHDS